MAVLRRLRHREPSWRRAPLWVADPLPVVTPAAAGIDADRLRMPASFDRLAAPPVFVTGSARSGTNFTLDVFGQHPDVCAITETWVLTQTHGVTAILAQREWDPRARRDVFERVGVPSAAAQLLPYEEMLHELGELVAGWLMRPVDGSQRFLVAKEPLDVLATAALFPEARVVHVIRDGRDVALSMRRASKSWDPTMGVGIPMSWRAEAWRRQLENVRQVRDHLGSRYLEVRYEDMRTDLTSVARTLFEFAGIPYDEDVLERVRVGTRLSGYPEAARRSGFRGRGEVGGWTREMSVRDAIGFSRAAGELLVELGYARDRHWWRGVLPGPLKVGGR